eukprot:Clim_evm9s209 gene=Clim_evmTU9s209
MKPFPYYAKPRQVDTFSLVDGKIAYDQRMRKYFNTRLVPPVDLNIGFDQYEESVEKNQDDVYNLDNFLLWILQGRKSVHPPVNMDATNLADFIMWRGTMSKLLCTPYESDSWTLLAVKHKHTIYLKLRISDTEFARQHGGTMPNRLRLMAYWGRKFEDYACIEDPNAGWTGHGRVNDKDQFCVIARACLGSNHVLLGAEVDCIDPGLMGQSPDPMDAYLELKTTAMWSGHNRGNQELHKFRRNRKAMKYWAQSFAGGIPYIVIGFRHPNGVVRDIARFPTNVFASEEHKQTYWEPTACANFAESLLDQIKATVVKQHTEAMYKLQYHPNNRQVVISEEAPNLHPVLPTWFTSSA